MLKKRGVAKVVSRQFRVLETVGSSPAASTKKRRIALAVILLFFVRVGEPTRHSCDSNVGSHIPPEILKACFQDAGSGYIRNWRKSRRSFLLLPWVLRRLASIVVSRATKVASDTPCFARARHEKQLSTVFPSLTFCPCQKSRSF